VEVSSTPSFYFLFGVIMKLSKAVTARARTISSSQRGLTLVEGLIVLALLGLIIVGVLYLYTNAKSENATNEVATSFQVTINGTRSLYATSDAGFGTADITAQLKQASKLPGSIKNGPAAGTFVNSFAGAFVVTGATNTFTVSQAGIARDICTSVVGSRLTNPTVVAVSVNGTALATLGNPAAAAAACNAATNTIVATAAAA
jgi:type II secretory pathway pseudopilin PulG